MRNNKHKNRNFLEFDEYDSNLAGHSKHGCFSKETEMCAYTGRRLAKQNEERSDSYLYRNLCLERTHYRWAQGVTPWTPLKSPPPLPTQNTQGRKHVIGKFPLPPWGSHRHTSARSDPPQVNRVGKSMKRTNCKKKNLFVSNFY